MPLCASDKRFLTRTKKKERSRRTYNYLMNSQFTYRRRSYGKRDLYGVVKWKFVIIIWLSITVCKYIFFFTLTTNSCRDNVSESFFLFHLMFLSINFLWKFYFDSSRMLRTPKMARVHNYILRAVLNIIKISKLFAYRWNGLDCALSPTLNSWQLVSLRGLLSWPA